MVTDPFAYLLSLEQFGIKFGLENITTIVEALEHPERASRSVHVAGTNGKGSVTAMVDAALTAAGHRSGRYTSPHILALNERFAVSGRPVADEDLASALNLVRDTVENLRSHGRLDVHPTYFEVTTAAAFVLFRQAGVEVAVLETGLGGRLDATNVVTPMACAITSIALDHQQYLGSTLAAIAVEKAGIVKPGVPIVVGDMTAEPAAVITRIARERDAPLTHASQEVTMRPVAGRPGRVRLRTRGRDYGEVVLALRGSHQVANAAVAVRLLEVLDECGVSVPAPAVVEGLANVTWPGRLETRRLPDGREVILDAAHNPAGATALSTYLAKSEPGRLPLVFSVMHDKDLDGMLRALLPAVGPVIVTRASNPRAANPTTVAARVRNLSPDRDIRIEPVPRDALAAAWHASSRIVVAGSIFLLADVFRELRTS